MFKQLGPLLIPRDLRPRYRKPFRVISQHLHESLNHPSAPDRDMDSRGVCTTTSLVVAEYLRCLGIPAAVISVSLEVIEEIPSIGGRRNLVVGHANGGGSGPGWNGHMVVVIEGMLIDATLHQIKRPWHELPQMVVVPLTWANPFPPALLFTRPGDATSIAREALTGYRFVSTPVVEIGGLLRTARNITGSKYRLFLWCFDDLLLLRNHLFDATPRSV